MYSISDIASAFGLKTTTLRYWIDKNNKDCEKEIYDFNLSELMQSMNVFRKTATKNNIGRHYRQLIIFDLDEFKKEFFRYVNFRANYKKNKKYKNLYWTDSAVDCYNCKMDCRKCFNKDICESIVSKEEEPPMKRVVRLLLEKIGKPTINNMYFI